MKNTCWESRTLYQHCTVFKSIRHDLKSESEKRTHLYFLLLFSELIIRQISNIAAHESSSDDVLMMQVFRFAKNIFGLAKFPNHEQVQTQIYDLYYFFIRNFT